MPTVIDVNNWDSDVGEVISNLRAFSKQCSDQLIELQNWNLNTYNEVSAWNKK